ncbi:hypothetical protein GCM10027256_11070 [Novispirillum itersonii subsp. nipponicum]
MAAVMSPAGRGLDLRRQVRCGPSVIPPVRPRATGEWDGGGSDQRGMSADCRVGPAGARKKVRSPKTGAAALRDGKTSTAVRVFFRIINLGLDRADPSGRCPAFAYSRQGIAGAFLMTATLETDDDRDR